MQMEMGVVQLLFVDSITSVFTDYLINFLRTVVIFTQKARVVDTQVNTTRSLPQYSYITVIE